LRPSTRAVFPVAVWAERVTEEVKVFRAGILQRGLRLVQRQPEFRHHRTCPRQRLVRVPAAEDDEAVGIRDDMRTERLAASGEPIKILGSKKLADDARQSRTAIASGAPFRQAAFNKLSSELRPSGCRSTE
jgi:hypothetical protein